MSKIRIISFLFNTEGTKVLLKEEPRTDDGPPLPVLDVHSNEIEESQFEAYIHSKEAWPIDSIPKFDIQDIQQIGITHSRQKVFYVAGIVDESVPHQPNYIWLTPDDASCFNLSSDIVEWLNQAETNMFRLRELPHSAESESEENYHL